MLMLINNCDGSILKINQGMILGYSFLGKKLTVQLVLLGLD